MKNKIYYLSRSYYPFQKGGGPLMRTGAVKYLQELGWDVTVVMPNYKNKKIKIKENIWQIPFKKRHIQKLTSLLERIGVYEGYLDKWVDTAFDYLKNIIQKDDIIFSTSGGELGMIKLGSLLKKYNKCKFIVNFRDPIDYSLVHGLKLNNKFHIDREKVEKKYLLNSDLIFTSSISNKQSLAQKYTEFRYKTFNNYFGYIENFDLELYKKKDSKKIRVAYVGNMTATQKPEILYEVFKNSEHREKIEIYFVGDRTTYKPLQNIQDTSVNFINFLPHYEFLKFMTENIDIGFVSLTSDYLGACVPSKIYEYINLGLPVIGALPNGDGKNIINDNRYGVAYKYDDIDNITMAIEKFISKKYLNEIRQNIIKDKEKWSMKHRVKEIDLLLKKIVNED